MSLNDSHNEFESFCQVMEEIYKIAPKEAFRINADHFCGYLFVNRSGKIIKKEEFKCAGGFLAKKLKDPMIDDCYPTERQELLVGVPSWENHSSAQNSDFYISGSLKSRESVHLRAIGEINQGELQTTFYNKDFLWGK